MMQDGKPIGNECYKKTHSHGKMSFHETFPVTHLEKLKNNANELCIKETCEAILKDIGAESISYLKMRPTKIVNRIKELIKRGMG